jgi:hypothetical protein
MRLLYMPIAASLLLAGCCGTVPFVPQPISPIPASKVSPIRPLITLETGTTKEMEAANIKNAEAIHQIVLERDEVRRMLKARGLLAGDE